MILRVVESTSGTIDELAAVLVAALEEAITARYGAGYVPKPDEKDDVAALIEDYRDLGIAVVTHLLDKATATAHGVRRIGLHHRDPGPRAVEVDRSRLTPASSPDRRRSAAPATPA